jgi:serine/threonine protein kinase
MSLVKSNCSKWIGEVVDQHFLLFNMDDRVIEAVISLNNVSLSEGIYMEDEENVLSFYLSKRIFLVSTFSYEDITKFHKLINKKRYFNEEYDIIETGRFIKSKRKSDELVFTTLIFNNNNSILVEKNINFLKRISSPYITKYIDHFTDKHYTYLILENFDSDLSTLLQHRKETLTAHLIESLIYQICSALKSLHKFNIGHFNLNPESIGVSGSNNNLKIIFLDMTYCVFKSNAMNYTSSNILFSAPELLKFTMEISADIWSLGLVIYYIFIGSLPNLSTLNASVYKRDMSNILYLMDKLTEFPVWANNIISRCLVKANDRITISGILVLLHYNLP